MNIYDIYKTISYYNHQIMIEDNDMNKNTHNTSWFSFSRINYHVKQHLYVDVVHLHVHFFWKFQVIFLYW